MKIKINIKSNLEREIILEKLKRVLFKSVLKMHELAVINCPVDKGFLKNSIFFSPTGSGATKYLLYVGAEYGPPVEFGTSPHIIRPRNKKALKFKVGNKTIFSKHVMHPGTEAQPFIRPAMDQVKEVWIRRYLAGEFHK